MSDQLAPPDAGPQDTVDDQTSGQSELARRQGRISAWIVATLVGGALLICSFLANVLFESTPEAGGGSSNFYATVLGVIAAIVLGARLVVVAVKDLAQGHAHMNGLVALAVLGAFAIHQYQESAAIALFMILAGLIEQRTAIGAEASIEALVKITPTRARKVQDNVEVEVEAHDLIPGDIVRILPGDNIPADGQIIRGSSTVNQANITGESLPVDKFEGDEVFGGTINLTGAMDVEVSKAGPDTTLGRVKDLILQAEGTRIPLMRLIDQYAGWYTPTILMIVAIVLFFNLRNDPKDAAERAITMLVIACPCAIILATPTAMVAGLSAAARLGVLFKSVVDLEAARNLTAMVFDKTGTLTTGELSVTRLKPAPGVQGVELLGAAGSIEQASRHPVARAVVEVARRAKLTLSEPTEFEEVAGRGVRAMVDGKPMFVGRAAWLTDGSVAQLDTQAVMAINQAQSSPDAEGLSVLFVVHGDRLLGWIGLEDNARAEAPVAMDQLRELGLKRLIIVTGDRASVAKRIASQLHISEFEAEVLPHQKLELVRQLKDKGHRVAVIGDGVNDAPALAAGDISIAMGAAGSDVAIHSANIALMNDNLNRIPFLIKLSRQTTRIIRQNLAIGAVFIVVFMVLAAAGKVTPIWAACLHVVSGLVVIFNSARLVRSGEDIEHAEAQTLARVQEAAPRQARPEAPPAPPSGVPVTT